MMQSILSDFDRYLLAEGTLHRAYERLGAHFMERDGQRGVQFAVWVSNAKFVSVIGDFNGWNISANRMEPSAAGVWEVFIPRLRQGDTYKYHIESAYRGYTVDKADPYCFSAEIRPQTASRVWDLQSYAWQDDSWMATRAKRNSLDAPISIYEVHLGSWRRIPEESNRPLTYREMARSLADHALELGFTHVELLRDAAGPDVSDRHPAPGGPRRDPRLGALPLPFGRARPRLFRRHAPLRA